MLVNRSRDEGSTLVTVLVTMLVLSTLAVTLAAVVTSTTNSMVTNRNSTEARAAADAGLAALVAKARQSPGGFCGMNLESKDAPIYEATSGECADGKVTFTSTGHGPRGAKTTVEAIYGYTEPSLPGGAGDMVFFGNTTFTFEVKTYSLDDDLLSIVIPTGDFTCQTAIPANILLSGNFYTKGGCSVAGGVAAGGSMDMAVSGDSVAGSVTMAGSNSNIIRGTIGGSLRTGGAIEFGWDGKHVKGNVEAKGNVQLSKVRIDGTLTLPADKSLTMNEGTVAGGISRPSSVSAPTAPTFDSWFDYSYKASDWPGFNVKKLVNSGDNTNPTSCAYYNNWPASGWFDLASLNSPTVIDARDCSNLSANSGKEPVVAIKTDIVFLANSFDLTKLTLNSASGNHRVWWVVEDKNENAKPSCSGSAGNITINHTVMAKELTTMAYTPCVVSVHGNSKWTGAFYGGSFNYGGGMSFHGDPIALPGQPTGEGGGPAGGAGGAGQKVLTALISRRDKQ